MANLEIGIVGVPGCGKTTLLNALSNAGAGTGGYSAGGKANMAIAPVPDLRLNPLANTCGALKIVPASIQLVDLPGITIGAESGGRGAAELLGQVRQVDALIHVVRCFDAAGIDPEPLNDLEGLEVELVAQDAEHTDRRLKNARSQAKSGIKEANDLVGELEAFSAHLNDGAPARTYAGDVPSVLDLLTDKPVLYVANTDESGSPGYAAIVEEYARDNGGSAVAMCAQVEAEIATLDADERLAFLEEMGIDEPGVNRVARAAFALLDLITFFTVGEKETRAWLVRRGADAQEAAGKIHSDIARGFIRAEVIDTDDLLEHGSHQEVAKVGKMRLEGKTYTVRDGDVLNVRFNV